MWILIAPTVIPKSEGAGDFSVGAQFPGLVEGRHHTIIVAAMGTILLVSGCIIERTEQRASEQGEYIVKEYRWRYGANTYTWEIPIPSSLYEHYRAMPRKGTYDEYVKDPNDDGYLGLLCSKLEETEVESDWSGKIDFALSFVQSLEYTDDELTGFDEYPRFPVETLVDDGGDCEDTSILFVSILRELGYGAVLLRFDEAGHMAAGVRVSEEVVGKWGKEYPLTYYESEGRYYAYCETTGSGWSIGERPSWVGEEAAVVIRA